jgi:hypothetical protein
VTRADAPKALEYNWGGFDMRWELEGSGGGTRLTLWTNIGHRFIAMGAAGWHICFDVLDHLLSGTPVGRIVGPEGMKFGGWQRLNVEYAKQFGIENAQLAASGASKVVNRNGGSQNVQQPRSTMNTAPWTVQVLWGVFFSVTGFGKILCYKPALWNQGLHEVPWFSAVP